MKETLWRVFPVDSQAKQEARIDRSGGHAVQSDEKHLAETAAWLTRAQDASPDGGVSRSYKAARYRGYGPCGWQASYPETTGYIIPSMFALSKMLDDPSFAGRAVKMADWEIEIQLPSGAVMGSVVTAPPSPAVFNTGQVIFGWIAAFENTKNIKYLEAAKNAADYLLSIQDEEGSWKKGDSRYAKTRSTTYNTRVAWALIELGLSAGLQSCIESGKKFIESALIKQKNNGWFRDNCLSDPSHPLLHTIIYAARGLLESGIALNEQRYIDAAIRTIEALLGCQRNDGGIPGRLDENWNSTETWDCVTGDAQASVAWLRAYTITGEKKFADAARKAVEFVKRTQNCTHANPGICGGVKGSFPFDGPYGQFEMLNWAAKFFIDAIILINDPKQLEKGIKG